MPAKTLLLLGAGHAHLLLTEHVAELRAAGLEPMLVAPRRFHYSGLATGVLSGALPDDANLVDVGALCARRGIAHVDATCTSISGDFASLSDGSSIPFASASVNVGSRIEAPFPARTAKPLANLTALKAMLRGNVARIRLVIAGAGPTGTEIAACLAGLARREGLRLHVTLCGPRKEGRGWPALYRSLERRGIDLLAPKVTEHRAGEAVLEDGTSLPCDHLVAATGLVPNEPAFAVRETLQSRDDPRIFAAGDCAHFLPRPLPKLGVFGVRQAPVLLRNLIAAGRGAPLTPYRPQRRWLSIMDLGNGEGFATWGPVAHRSRAALALKRRLDFAFVRRFR
jgi:NADH dehydrogenase FAD-containing subunit